MISDLLWTTGYSARWRLSRTGERSDLGGHKQRALLAVLLLDANHFVSTDRLTDALWEEKPPERPARRSQVYVSELRKQLEKSVSRRRLQAMC